MGSRVRSSAGDKMEKSWRSLGESSTRRQERLRRRKNIRRSNTPKKNATSYSVPSKKVTHRSPPLRKSKPSPVNELDIFALSQKEQQSKSG